MNENLKAWLKDIAIAVLLAIIISQFIRPTIVKEHSMEPTLQNNNYIFFAKQAYLFHEPRSGDIVIFRSHLKSETGKNKLLIKRVIAVGGDTISIKDGKVFRNGEELKEPFILEQYTSQFIDQEKIPEGKMFVMGDNRQNSADSRFAEVGLVDVDSVLGRAFFRLYPFDEIGVLH